MDNNETENKADPEEFVRENRKKIIAVVRSSGDPLTRACAWALLDKHTSDADLDDLHEELDAIARQEDSK